jgi:2-dehydro-3-deoxygluconokinase
MTLDVFTLGETMLRLSPPGNLRLEQATSLDIAFGGTESNVAVALSRLGKRVAWHSRLPENPMGRQVAAALLKQGVNVDSVMWSKDERLGVYFIEYGSPPRGIQVWYDRADSAASKITPGDLPLELIRSAGWLHVTGITAALSESCAETVSAAVDIATENGVNVSLDVNYRAKLWDAATAAAVLNPLCEKADVVIVAARDAHSLWDAPMDAIEAARMLQGRWGGTVIVTRGEAGSVGYDGADLAQADAIPVEIVDRIGAGDAFAGGVICGLLDGLPLRGALQFGSAVAALKLTIPGDMALVSRVEVEALLGNQRDMLSR